MTDYGGVLSIEELILLGSTNQRDLTFETFFWFIYTKDFLVGCRDLVWQRIYLVDDVIFSLCQRQIAAFPYLENPTLFSCMRNNLQLFSKSLKYFGFLSIFFKKNNDIAYLFCF